MFCNIINVFTATFDQFSASLLNTSMNFLKKTSAVSHKSEYTPHISAINLVYLFNGQYYRNETWI